MIIIIQCAASKRYEAGYLQRSNGKKVMFVADPQKAPHRSDIVYAHPDDIAEDGKSWRKKLVAYNKTTENSLGLLPAWRLYRHPTYRKLYEYSAGGLYILSAGWGLLAADFLTPAYDITFSQLAKHEKYKRRYKNDDYDDLNMLPADTKEPVVFFVSTKYIPLASELTKQVKAPKHLFYKSAQTPDAPSFHLVRYNTKTSTNWHYECAKAFMGGEISI